MAADRSCVIGAGPVVSKSGDAGEIGHVGEDTRPFAASSTMTVTVDGSEQRPAHGSVAEAATAVRRLGATAVRWLVG